MDFYTKIAKTAKKEIFTADYADDRGGNSSLAILLAVPFVSFVVALAKSEARRTKENQWSWVIGHWSLPLAVTNGHFRAGQGLGDGS